MEENNDVIETYPGLLERIKAIIVDSISIFVFMGIATIIFSNFDNPPDIAKKMTFIFIFILYDPIFTSLFGGTIGHFIMGIRVKRHKDQSKNILFPLAIFRFILKAVLGWISLLTVTGNKKKMAIHDFAVGSVVVYYKNS